MINVYNLSNKYELITNDNYLGGKSFNSTSYNNISQLILDIYTLIMKKEKALES